MSMDSIPELEGGEIELVAHVHTPTSTAEAYGKELSVTPSSKTTTIAKVSLRNTVRRRGVDFINRLVSFYNQDANDEKNEVAQKTAEFIEERIGIINGELGTTESELAAFKQRSGLTNLTSDAQMALQESSRLICYLTYLPDWQPFYYPYNRYHLKKEANSSIDSAI